MPEIKILTSEQLKQFRKENKLSQMELAEIMGYSRKSYMQIWKHETGRKSINDIHAWQNLMTWCQINELVSDIKAGG